MYQRTAPITDQAKTAVNMDATSGLGETNPDRVQIADTSTFAVGDRVQVRETAGDAAHIAGEYRTVTVITANDYLTVDSNLTLTYLVANDGEVIRVNNRALGQNSVSAMNGTVGGTGTIQGQVGNPAALYCSTIAAGAALTLINASLVWASGAGGITYSRPPSIDTYLDDSTYIGSQYLDRYLA